MTAQSSDRIWLASAGRISGPFDLGQLRQMEGSLRLSSHCQVRPEGQRDWISYGEWKSRQSRAAAKQPQGSD